MVHLLFAATSPSEGQRPAFRTRRPAIMNGAIQQT
jgi:hypothetical protein